MLCPVSWIIILFLAPTDAIKGLRGWAAARMRAVQLAANTAAPLDSDYGSKGLGALDGSEGSWKGSGSKATLIFSAPSTMDPAMVVEVRERAGGWRTLSLVGPRQHIMHGMCRMLPDGSLDPSAALPEYIRSQAALALAGMEMGASPRRAPAHRVLVLGLGAALLPSLLAYHLPRCALTALELDATVVQAAKSHLGLDTSRVRVITEDALTWIGRMAAEHKDARQIFDAVLIDIFDARNECPADFYSDEFLEQLHSLLSENGVLVHNLHVGNARLRARLEIAAQAHARAFASTGCLLSRDSKPWAGNALLCASRGAHIFGSSTDGSAVARTAAARSAWQRYGLPFDLEARCSPMIDVAKYTAGGWEQTGTSRPLY